MEPRKMKGREKYNTELNFFFLQKKKKKDKNEYDASYNFVPWDEENSEKPQSIEPMSRSI
jgi:hypothetical protein